MCYSSNNWNTVSFDYYTDFGNFGATTDYTFEVYGMYKKLDSKLFGFRSEGYLK
jgi:hypothetical protein